MSVLAAKPNPPVVVGATLVAGALIMPKVPVEGGGCGAPKENPPAVRCGGCGVDANGFWCGGVGWPNVILYGGGDGGRKEREREQGSRESERRRR